MQLEPNVRTQYGMLWNIRPTSHTSQTFIKSQQEKLFNFQTMHSIK